MIKELSTIIGAFILAVGLFVAAGNIPQADPTLGAGSVPGVTLFPQTSLENTFTIPASASTTGGYTLSVAESGSLIFLEYGSTTITLPGVRDEISYKFVVTSALADANVVIDSAEGDNINGTLSVNNADVDCSGEDQLNFVIDGETIGDYVQLYSDGSQWLIGDSGVNTAAKLTCTDPS